MMALQPEYASELGHAAEAEGALLQPRFQLRQRYVVFLGLVLAGYSLAGRGLHISVFRRFSLVRLR